MMFCGLICFTHGRTCHTHITLIFEIVCYIPYFDASNSLFMKVAMFTTFITNFPLCPLPENTFSTVSLLIDGTLDCNITFYPQSPSSRISEMYAIFTLSKMDKLANFKNFFLFDP